MKRRKKIDGAALVARYKANGLTIAEFSRRNGLSPGLLNYHLKRSRTIMRGGGNLRNTKEPNGFLPVGRENEQTFELEKGGVTLRLPTAIDSDRFATILEVFRRGE